MTHDKKHPTDNAITNAVSDNNTSTTINHRRNSLKKMAVGTTILGGATASQWSQPIINSVISPAHAQATGLTCTTGSQTFDSPGEFEFIVPDCATQVTVEVRGAGGGSADNSLGGIGGRSTGVLNVSSGEVLTIYVGQRGQDASVGLAAPGGIGFGNGGSGASSPSTSIGEKGAGGGGGSAVLQAGLPKIIAGGGGGASSVDTGSNGGGSSPSSGYIDTGLSGSSGIGGASVDVPDRVGGNVGTGNFGGGNGGSHSIASVTVGGGGGGGGYGGGAAGGTYILYNGAGGGGGGLTVPNGRTEEGVGNTGNGSITISW